MGFRTTVPTVRAAALTGLAAGLLGASAGCQPTPEAMGRRLVARMALIDFSGLGPAQPIPGLDLTAALPRTWALQPVHHSGLFTHVQWRSPTHATAVGVAVVHLPLPLSAKALVWLAKAKYNDGKADPAAAKGVPGGPGRLIGQWTDSVGREWVEAENDHYHVRGYVVTFGFDAWIAYAGYRRHGVPDPVDIDLAYRSLESIVPGPLAAHPAGH